MFIKNDKDIQVPKNAKVSWVVKYKGGRKPFPTEREARRFMGKQKAEGSWVELTEQIEIVRVARK